MAVALVLALALTACGGARAQTAATDLSGTQRLDLLRGRIDENLFDDGEETDEDDTGLDTRDRQDARNATSSRDTGDAARTGDETTGDETTGDNEGTTLPAGSVDANPPRTTAAGTRPLPPEPKEGVPSLAVPAADKPYDPLGVQAGSFLIFPEVNAGYVYTDNVFETGTGKQGDSAFEVIPKVRVQSDWSRHSLSGEASIRKRDYATFSSENEQDVNAVLRGRIDVRRRTNIEAETSYAETTGSRGDINVPNAVLVPPNETAAAQSVRLNHTFNRLSARLGVERVHETYEDAPLAGGGIFLNSNRDNVQTEESARLSYEFKPGVSVFGEGRVNQVELDRTNPGDTSLDSAGHALIGGFSFDLNGKLTGEFGFGYAQQSPEVDTLQGIDGFIFTSDLTWKPTALTTLRLNADYGLDTTAQFQSIGSLTKTYGISLEHQLRRSVIVTAAAVYQSQEYAGINLTDDTVETTLGLEYLFTRWAGLLVQAGHTESFGSGVNDDYSENEVRVGMRLRR